MKYSTDTYGYTFDEEVGFCTSQLNGRTIIFEKSGTSSTMRETPHLIDGHEIRTGGISFVYAETDQPVSDGDWDDFHCFKQTVRGAYNCLTEHYNEDGLHMVLKTHAEREARWKSERDHLLFTDSQTESGPTVNVITTNGASYHTIEGVPVRIDGLAFVYDDGSHVPDSTWTRAELTRFVRTAKDNRKRMNLTR